MTNIFIEHIYNKKKYSLKSYIKYRKFIKKLKTAMPNFGMLWQISDFIKILEEVYFYNNTPKSPFGMYSSRQYGKGENGFCVLNEDVCIKYKLFEKIETIAIDIERLQGNKGKSSMVFGPDIKDELNDIDSNMLANIVDITMNSTIKLLKEYYKKKI